MPKINEKRLKDLFFKLCSFNSPSLHEGEIVAWTKTHLESFGLEVWEDEAGKRIGGNGNNLIVRLKGTIEGAPRIFLSAHFDTVEPTKGLVIGDKDGVYFSESDTILGADDKGGLAPAIEAVLSLKESGEEHGEIYLLLSVAEEIGLKGASNLKIEDYDFDFGYVLDTGPPVGTYVNRTATHDKLEITLNGRPAHAGKDPENGINAIQILADAVSGMPMGRIDEETTANLGIVQGGTAVNVVCPFVKIYAEARSTSVAKLDQVVGEIIHRFEASASKFGGTAEVVHDRHYKSYIIDESEKVVQIARAASESINLEFALRTTLGGSDANIYNAKGVKTLVVGTGMEKIHTHEERISQADLVQTAELALALLLETSKVSR